jgi:hypothetical protein
MHPRPVSCSDLRDGHACVCFNPDFDEGSAAWDAESYYSDPSNYNRKDLGAAGRLGMSCGFCHVGPSPVHP